MEGGGRVLVLINSSCLGGRRVLRLSCKNLFLSSWMLGMSRKVLTLRREKTNLVGRLDVWQALILWLVVNWPRKSLSPCTRKKVLRRMFQW